MTYALVSQTASGTLAGFILKTMYVLKTAQNDMVMFSDSAGVIPLSISVMTNGASGSFGVPDTWEYAVIRSLDGDTAAETTIHYDTAIANERLSGNYFIVNPSSREYIYVYNDSGYEADTGTLKVKRGALGSTAAVIADNQYMGVMNCIKLLGSGTGYAQILYLDLAQDPGAEMF